jgi:hypothetical protein
MNDGFFPFCPLKSRDCGWARDDLIECRVGRWYEKYRNSYVWIWVVVVRCVYVSLHLPMQDQQSRVMHGRYP